MTIDNNMYNAVVNVIYSVATQGEQMSQYWVCFNTLRPRQNGRHFADDIFTCIFLYENARILLEISLKFVPKDAINNIPALVQIMAWRRLGDKPLSEPMMVWLLTHICVTRPQWVKWLLPEIYKSERRCLQRMTSFKTKLRCFWQHSTIHTSYCVKIVTSILMWLEEYFHLVHHTDECSAAHWTPLYGGTTGKR